MFAPVVRAAVVLLATGCAGAPTPVPNPSDPSREAASPCRDPEAPSPETYEPDDEMSDELSDAIGTFAPCLDAAGEEADCGDRIDVRFIDALGDPAEHDLIVHVAKGDRTTRYRSVVGAVSGGACGWEVEHASSKVGPWIVARIAGTAFSYDVEGCTREGVHSALAVVDARSGALASVIQCIGDAPATAAREGDRLVVSGCRAERPSFGDAELRACIAADAL